MMTKGGFKALVQVHHPRSMKRLPRMAHPLAQARRYSRALRGKFLADAMAIVRAKLIPKLEAAAESASRVATTARGDADQIGFIMDDIETDFFDRWTRKRMADLVEPVAEEIEKFQATQLNRSLREAVGVDVVGSEPWLKPAIDEFVHENVSLIKTIPTRFFGDLESNVKRELANGARWEELAGIVEERYGVAQSRAQLIARDQAGKFFGDLNRTRQADLGIDRAVWRTMLDNRVRPEHEDREGEIFDWKDGLGGEIPGEPVQCRCYGEPDLSGLLGEDFAPEDTAAA